MKEEFDDPSPVAVEMILEVNDGSIPVIPDVLVVDGFFGKALF